MNLIVMTEDYWINSQFSIARFCGKIRIDNHEFVIVNKDGKDIFQLSAEAHKAGRKNAIEPNEPADLCRTDFVPIYRKLGRDRFLKFLEDNPTVTTPKQAKKILKGDTKGEI